MKITEIDRQRAGETREALERAISMTSDAWGSNLTEEELLLLNNLVEAFKDAEVPRCSATMNSSPSPKS